VALALGALGGALSVLGYHYVTPFLSRCAYLHDTCGVLNLHGVPGVLSGLACEYAHT
jgi:ammonium transporter Rh